MIFPLLVIAVLQFRLFHQICERKRMIEATDYLQSCFMDASPILIGYLDDNMLITEICSRHLNARRAEDCDQFVILVGILSRLDPSARLYFGAGSFRDEQDPTQFQKVPLFWLQYKYRGHYYISYFYNGALHTSGTFKFIATTRETIIAACEYKDIAYTIFEYYTSSL